MLTLCADEKKAIIAIIIILWRGDKVLTDVEQRRKGFAIVVCQSLQLVALGSSMKRPKGEQSRMSRIEQIMLPLE